jgi:hypothetical protein
VFSSSGLICGATVKLINRNQGVLSSFFSRLV